MKAGRGFSIGGWFSLIALSIVAGSQIVSAAWHYRTEVAQNRAFRIRTAIRSVTQLQYVLEAAEVRGDLNHAEQALAELGTETDLKRAVLIDPEGVIRLATHLAWRGQAAGQAVGALPLADELPLLDAKGSALRIALPVRFSGSARALRQVALGMLLVDYDFTTSEVSTLQTALRELLPVLGIQALALLALLLLTRQVISRPLTAIAADAEAIVSRDDAGPNETPFAFRELNHLWRAVQGASRTMLLKQKTEAELRHAQALLGHSEQRLLMALANSNDGVMLLDFELRPLFAGGSKLGLFGFSPEAILERGIDSVVREDRGPFLRLLARVRRKPGGPEVTTVRVHDDRGQVRWVEAVAMNRLTEPGAGVLVINFRDVTDRRESEERIRQSMKMQAIGRLAAGIAHDFNNIMTVVAGHADLLAMHLEPGSPLRDHVAAIQNSRERAAFLTGQLLAFGRDQVEQTETVSIHDLLNGAGRLLLPLCGEDIRLVVEADPEPLFVRAVPGKMEQILLNLALNARDAMPNGGKLAVRARASHAGGPGAGPTAALPAGVYVVLEVEDNGVGIPPEIRERIFEPFFTTKPAGKGTGIGLATTYALVSQLGGAIELESTEGEGTTFRVRIPLAIPADTAADGLPRNADQFQGTGTILLVEDEADLRDVAATVLRSHGYSVLEARNGAEALEIFAGLPPDSLRLVITDVAMPELNGRELAQRIHAQSPWLPVLFVSGYTDDPELRGAMGALEADFLAKPFSSRQLLERVKRLLDLPAPPTHA